MPSPPGVIRRGGFPGGDVSRRKILNENREQVASQAASSATVPPATSGRPEPPAPHYELLRLLPSSASHQYPVSLKVELSVPLQRIEGRIHRSQPYRVDHPPLPVQQIQVTPAISMKKPWSPDQAHRLPRRSLRRPRQLLRRQPFSYQQCPKEKRHHHQRQQNISRPFHLLTLSVRPQFSRLFHSPSRRVTLFRNTPQAFRHARRTPLIRPPAQSEKCPKRREALETI